MPPGVTELQLAWPLRTSYLSEPAHKHSDLVEYLPAFVYCSAQPVVYRVKNSFPRVLAGFLASDPRPELERIRLCLLAAFRKLMRGEGPVL